MKFRWLSIFLALAVVSGSLASMLATPNAAQAAQPLRPIATPTPAVPASPGAPAPTQASLSTSAATVEGPNDYPAGVNPLTGLPVDDPSLLDLPPALVSVSNFPVTARPQTGLSLSPMVFEMYIGEGMTRFLALFYGKFASANTDISDTAEVGPVRSGRLPYESLRQLYNGFLIMAGAYKTVAQSLSDSTNVFGADPNDINSASVNIQQLETIARANQKATAPSLGGMVFQPAAPQGGSPADKLWVFYNYLNQVEWNYDASSGAYLRSQDNADGSGKFYPATDKLTGQQLAFQNVVVLYANHVPRAETLINVDLLDITKGRALLFRDGRAYDIYWSTTADAESKKTGLYKPIKFFGADGQPMAFKPGNTWVEMVSFQTTTQELQPGTWKVRYFNPPIQPN